MLLLCLCLCSAQIGLEVVDNDPDAGVLTVRGPPDYYVAMPGMYMLFLLNGDIYSEATWVTLPRSD